MIFDAMNIETQHQISLEMAANMPNKSCKNAFFIKKFPNYLRISENCSTFARFFRAICAYIKQKQYY